MSDDLIRRSDAIKVLRKRWARTIHYDGIGEDIGEECEEAINAVPSADRPQEWIPCSERLPEEREWIGTKKFGTTISDEVLVTFESRGERFVRPIHFQNGELGGMDKHTMDAVHGEWKAVAWMPLPKPWKGADDEV